MLLIMIAEKEYLSQIIVCPCQKIF